MAKNEDDRGLGEERPQDPLVDRLRPDPSQRLQAAITFAGLLAACRDAIDKSLSMWAGGFRMRRRWKVSADPRLRAIGRHSWPV